MSVFRLRRPNAKSKAYPIHVDNQNIAKLCDHKLHLLNPNPYLNKWRASNIDLLDLSDLRRCNQCFIFHNSEHMANRTLCYKCHRVQNREWARQNKNDRKYYYIEKNYGLNYEQVRQLVKEQKNKCAICQEHITIGGNRATAQVDHCHATGDPRGLLCARCNSGLSYFNDNPELLREAVKYLS